MIHAGDTIENPITGERIVFNKTSAETGGEAVEIEVYVRPGGVVAAAHVHPYQSERFEVISGRIGMKLGRRSLEAGPNDIVVVEPGTPHKFWNAGDEELHFVTVVKPALQFERLLETMFGLAADGKTNRKGMPNPLRLAVIAQAHFDDVEGVGRPAATDRREDRPAVTAQALRKEVADPAREVARAARADVDRPQ